LGDLVNVLNHGEFKAKKEATWAVTNLTSGGKPHQMMKLIELGVIEPLISMLGCNDIKIVQVNYSCPQQFFGPFQAKANYFQGYLGWCNKYSEHGRRPRMY